MIPAALVYFREVAGCGSIRRAADKLSISPSAVSRQISNLEAQLQTSLMDRRAQRLCLAALRCLDRCNAHRHTPH